MKYIACTKHNAFRFSIKFGVKEKYYDSVKHNKDKIKRFPHDDYFKSNSAVLIYMNKTLLGLKMYDINLYECMSSIAIFLYLP